MKTIICNKTANSVSKYLFADDKNVTLNEHNIVVGIPAAPDFIIGDMNNTNATLVEDVTAPEDWYGGKYFYIDGTWSVDPNWVDPQEGGE